MEQIRLVYGLPKETITLPLPIPPLGQDMTQGQFFKQSLTGVNLEFSFSKTSCLIKAEEPSRTIGKHSTHLANEPVLQP